MKSILASKMILLAAVAAGLIQVRSQAAESVTDAIEAVRFTYRADRQALVGETLQLTATEAAAFWPLYRSYRADMDKLGDGLVKLILEYADVYPNVPEDRAHQLLKNYTALEEKLASKRASYLKRAAKSLPAAKVLRWAQLENRMDLGLRLQLANAIPMMPDTGSKP
jgi:hypothetical protein